MKNNPIIVDETMQNIRIDKVLTMQVPEHTRSYFQKVIEAGSVEINGEVCTKTNTKVEIDDVITWSVLAEKPSEIVAVDIPLDIIYEDDDIAVINKAIGMVVHPAPGHYDDTLVNALLFHFKDLSTMNGLVRPGIVHRIDKDTSGLLVIAKNDESHLHLSNQLQDKSLYRLYTALVHGIMKESKFTVDMPIGRSSEDRKKMTVRQDGRDARTHVKVLGHTKEYTLVTCQLETGRTHQIRVHLQAIGYPLVGDATYTKQGNPFGLTGQFLHAQKLGLIHPKTGAAMEFTAPLPETFTKILGKIAIPMDFA